MSGFGSLVQHLPRAVPSQPIARVSFPDLPEEIVGFWSLWRVALDPDAWRDVKILPLFLHDDGRILVPTARMIWDCLLEDRPRVSQLGYVARDRGGLDLPAITVGGRTARATRL